MQALTAPTTSNRAAPVKECCWGAQAGYWRDYCELDIATNTPGAVKALFSRCLLTCLSVDLWKAYLGFIRKVRGRAGGRAGGWVGGWAGGRAGGRASGWVGGRGSGPPMKARASLCRLTALPAGAMRPCGAPLRGLRAVLAEGGPQDCGAGLFLRRAAGRRGRPENFRGALTPAL